ncbi:LysR family transcriptional regulator [Corynebacterium alimapuense]|uniref:LysR family transcriptional regulator n=1 Tax=Corynebacterium alimapuense TaxID=1576874 RepID=A0A3M8K9K3_9CORY|nr:LysR family transcriptional regulator [Corynebacterium alimapuense]RNE49569.1 LysR family transcriptional regulator [Corynebacterium alimapuense]
MSSQWPNLQSLELIVAVADEGSIGAGARKVGMAQPNASKAIVELEAQLGTELFQRSPRGARPTTAGLSLAEHARELLTAAHYFTTWAHTLNGDEQHQLRVGASMTIAETLLPAWLSELKRQVPAVCVEVDVLNSAQIIDQVQRGNLQLGFVETPHVPVRLNAQIVQEDELVVAISPTHKWADRLGKISLAELAATPLVVREAGSGTREALDEVLDGLEVAPPAQVLSSNAAVRVAVSSGAGPAALSELALREQLASGELMQVPFHGQGISRPLTAVWSGPKKLTGIAARLVAVAAT